MLKVKLMKNLNLGNEVMTWCDENGDLHEENHYLCDAFKKVFEHVKLFITLSMGLSRSVQLLCD